MKLSKNKMTKKVGLVLVSSSLILSGCSHHTPPQDPNNPNQAIVTQPVGGGTNWWYFHSGYPIGYSGPGYSGGSFSHTTVTHTGVSGGAVSKGGFTASPSVSSRGGFGAAGHSFGASSVS